LEDIGDLRKRAIFLEPVVRIGKNGLTPSVLEEIRMHLKKKKLVKVRVLKSALTEDSELKKESAKDFAALLADKTGAQLVQSIGLNVVLNHVEGKAKSSVAKIEKVI
jgi:RNA-binding protein